MFEKMLRSLNELNKNVDFFVGINCVYKTVSKCYSNCFVYE